MSLAEREISFQPLLGMGCPSPSLLNSENWNKSTLMRFSEFKGERSAFRMPPQAAYEGFPLSAKSIPISVEADAAEDESAPRESERAVEAGDVGGQSGKCPSSRCWAWGVLLHRC